MRPQCTSQQKPTNKLIITLTNRRKWKHRQKLNRNERENRRFFPLLLWSESIIFSPLFLHSIAHAVACYLRSHRNATHTFKFKQCYCITRSYASDERKQAHFHFIRFSLFSQSMRPTCTCLNASCNDCGATARDAHKILIRFGEILCAHKFTIQFSSLDPFFFRFSHKYRIFCQSYDINWEFLCLQWRMSAETLITSSKRKI